MKKSNIIYLLPALILLILSGCSQSGKKNFSVNYLRTEYLKHPLSVDLQHPRFAWNMESSKRGSRQKAYQILVAHSPKDLTGKKADMWNSKKISSDKSTNIAYEGKSLKSNQTYYWKVRVWNQKNKATWSKVDTFHTGLLNKSDWKASWISTGDTTISAPLLRKKFSLKKTVKHATAFVTGMGFYRLYLNGKKVGDHVLDPGITTYKKRILYSTYNVTNQLKKGDNAVGIMLGNGPWRMHKAKGRYTYRRKQLLGPLEALMQLNITFTDGTDTTIATNNSWKYHSGPVTYNNVYGGEDYDARKIQKGWDAPGFNDSGWNAVKTVDGPSGTLKAQLMPAIKVIKTITPVKEVHPKPGLYIYDLGQNIPGWWRIQVQGKKGLKLQIHGAETLDDSLFPKPLEMKDRLSTKFKYHSQVYTDYTLNGKGTETFEPGFFYTGFRYIAVRTKHPKDLKSLSVQGRVVETALKRAGHFSSSDSLLNKIHHATVWAQIGNTHSYPSDCPTREKGAYTGDGEVVAESALHDFDMGAFYTNWVADMHNTQQDNGRITNTAPQMLGGHGGGIAWGSAYILIPWWMHQYYGDTRLMQKYYTSMQKYMHYLHHLARNDSKPKEKYIINNFDGFWFSLGEWCAPGQNDGPNHPVVSTAYWYNDAVKFADIAQTLGKNKDASHYRALADSIKNAFNKKFLNTKTNLYGTKKPYQTYLVLALAFNLVPQAHRADVTHQLVNDIRQNHNDHLNTGILGTKYLFPVLMNSGHADLAYKILTQTTYPGWGFWMKHGATTLWEKWSGKDSHNHQMFGSVDEFLYEYLAGIRAPTDKGTSTAYKHILIKPYVPDTLKQASASLETVRGNVQSKWVHSGHQLELDVTLPANTSGAISIPRLGMNNVTVTADGKQIWNNGKYVSGGKGITGGTREGQYITFNVGSGSYKFKLAGE